jgi:DNA-directed RNA polymerase specialized sigma24 family protein
MSAGYVIPVDPSDLARFSYEDPRFDDEDDELDPEELEGGAESLASFIPDGDYESRIAPLLDRIPEREADLIFLYFIEKKRQADIATIFGVTQAAISYRLDRGIQRLKFLLNIPQVTEEDLRADLPAIFPTKLGCPNCETGADNCLICMGSKEILVDVEILVGMWMTTCQSEVASKLGLTQGRVRHRFFKAVQTLEDVAKLEEKFQPYQQIFSAVASKKFNILREVKLPQWADRGGDECI